VVLGRRLLTSEDIHQERPWIWDNRCQVERPTIQLQVTTVDPQLYVLLRFKSGTLKLYVSEDDDDDTTNTWDTTGWVFAFSVKIGRYGLWYNTHAD